MDEGWKAWLELREVKQELYLTECVTILDFVLRAVEAMGGFQLTEGHALIHKQRSPLASVWGRDWGEAPSRNWKSSNEGVGPAQL